MYIYMKTKQERFRTKRAKKTKRKNRTKQKKTRKMTQRRKRTQRGGTMPNSTSMDMMDKIFRGTIFEPYDKFIILKKYYENKGLVFAYTNLQELLNDAANYSNEYGNTLIRRFLRDVTLDDLEKLYQNKLQLQLQPKLQPILTKRDEEISKYNEKWDKEGVEGRHTFLNESPHLPKIDGGWG